MKTSFYTTFKKYYSPVQRYQNCIRGQLFNTVFKLQFVIAISFKFSPVSTQREVYSHTNEWNDYLCLVVCYKQKILTGIERDRLKQTVPENRFLHVCVKVTSTTSTRNRKIAR